MLLAPKKIILFGLFLSLNVTAQECLKPLLVFEKLNKEHIAPKSLDDSLSAKVFVEMFHNIDPHGLVFTKATIASFAKFKYGLDDDIRNRNCQFLTTLQSAYQSRILSVQKRIDSLLNSPIEFQSNEKHKSTSFTESPWVDSEKALVAKFKTDIKRNVLSYASRMADQKEGKLNEASVQKFIVEGQNAEKKRQHSLLDKWQSHLSGEGFLNAYLNAITKAFDPHSDFFTQKDRDRFTEQLSTDRKSFGIVVEESVLGDVTIERLVPGSPAWRSNLLHRGDRLVQIIGSNHSEVDLAFEDAFETQQTLDEFEDNAIIVALKSTGEKVVVSLQKEKIENTENSVSGFLLKGEKKIGYIQLPGFFQDEEGNGKNGCANEVAKEIIKLNRMKMEGLILDLRYNGGGSLQEAIDLAGIFIDAGPIAIVELKNEQPVTLKDANKGVSFSGPMVVLVNSGSASASELVAAALQDYNRALIVGSPTFGKATGQQLLPLTPNAVNGYLKITDTRIFRINQKSHQQKGVQPDIVLPEVATWYYPTERRMRNSLLPTTTTKKTYYNIGPLTYLEPWQTASRKRLEASEKFSTIKEVDLFLSQPVELNLMGYIEYVNKANRLLKTITQKPVQNIFQVLPAEDISSLDNYRKAPETLMQEILSSPYIQEAYYILSDVIQWKK